MQTVTADATNSKQKRQQSLSTNKFSGKPQ